MVAPPRAEDVLVAHRLRAGATDRPDEVMITFEDGATWTRREAFESGCGAAERLSAAGVRQGDVVAVVVGNGPEFLRAWFGIALLGATLLPVNPAYKGALLHRPFTLGGPAAIVAASDTLASLAGEGVPAIDQATHIDVAGLDHRSPDAPEPGRPLALHDPAVLLMTSGTTGPSKLAVNSAWHMYLGGAWFVEAAGRGPEDVLLLDLPMFHGAALWFGTAAIVTGTRLVVRSAPALREYWEVAREHGVTMGLLLSTMVPFLLQQPPRPADREHQIRVMISTPLPKDLQAFKERFGLPEVRTGYGLTEAPGVVTGPESDAAPGPYCGRARAGYEVRLVDENDLEVPVGEPGQLIVRAEHPWMLAPEYVGDPAATAAAWRNGWFHTGDLLRQDAEGRFFFVDRVTDSMRRRGENISSVEVEAELRAYPGVKDAVCVPYREPDGVEDEVKAWIQPEPGVAIDFADLLRFAADRLSHFMVPRYFEAVDEFPLTVSMRVKKFELRARGNGPGCWDREAHGLRVTRKGVEPTHA